MEPLSIVLCELAESRAREAEIVLDKKGVNSFIWIWHSIMAHQPAEVLQNELRALVTYTNGTHAEPQYLLEIAWKAKVLEALLGADQVKLGREL